MKSSDIHSEFSGLSTLIINKLRNQGLDTKKDVLSALRKQKINTKTKGFGKKTIADLCKWAGVDIKKTKPAPSQQAINSAIKFLENNGYQVCKTS